MRLKVCLNKMAPFGLLSAFIKDCSNSYGRDGGHLTRGDGKPARYENVWGPLQFKAPGETGLHSTHGAQSLRAQETVSSVVCGNQVDITARVSTGNRAMKSSYICKENQNAPKPSEHPPVRGDFYCS